MIACPFEKYSERLDGAFVPEVLAHGCPVRAEAADVLAALAVNDASLEPTAAAEHWVLPPAPQLDQPAAELQQLLVGLAPVVPADFVILAVGIVLPRCVRPISSPPEKHRHTLRKQEGGEEVALLARP